MSLFAYANNVQTTLNGNINSTATTITLASTANFPTIPAGYYWAVTLNDAATKQVFEVMYATENLGGGQLQVIRGQEGTTAQSWLTGDKAFASVTAGMLSALTNQAQLASFVQLSPPSQQIGNIYISGTISGGFSNFGGVSVGGVLTGATTGSFTGTIDGPRFSSTLPYTNTAGGDLALLFNGGGGTIIGVGPTTLASINGVTADALAIFAVSTGKFVAFDKNGSIGAYGDVIANGRVLGLTVYQNSIQVVDTLTSSTLTLSKSGNSYAINIPNATQIPVGGVKPSSGNGGQPSITLPNYGQWFIEVVYGLQQITNGNMTISLALTGGTITSGFLTNANGHTAFNAESIIALYGNGLTTVNNQTLTFTLSASGGSFDGSNQPWAVRATRTA